MADIIRDNYDETKEWGRLIYQRGKDLVGDELNEMQDIERILRRRSFSSIFGHGFITAGFQILESVNPNEILIESGDALIQGEHLENASQYPISGLTTPSGADRTDIVYLKVQETEIDAATDADMEFPDIGETARRIKLTWEVIVDEGSVSLPATTGDMHAAGIHYELLGYLFRLDGVTTITTAQISDARRIIGFVFLNEDKNLEVVGGGVVGYTAATGAVTFTSDIRIIQPSTSGHALVDTSESGFALLNPGDVAYVVLDRDAVADYNVPIIVGTWNTIPNNSNTYPLFYRSDDNLLYAVEGTVWADGQSHSMRTNPFTGLIVDADVAAIGVANINGDKIAIGSMNADRIYGLPTGVPTGGIILWDESAAPGCPAGYTQMTWGSNDTYIRIVSSGSANTTPAGSNTHNHGSHQHSSGSYKTPIQIFDFNLGGVGVPFDAFPQWTGAGGGVVQFDVTGWSGSTSVSTVSHEPKQVSLLLCRKN